jgi:hypothetical protein
MCYQKLFNNNKLHLHWTLSFALHFGSNNIKCYQSKRQLSILQFDGGRVNDSLKDMSLMHRYINILHRQF